MDGTGDRGRGTFARVEEASLEGVVLRPLELHADARGDLTEVFRASWLRDLAPVQWNLCRSRPGTLRGVHVHPTHWDYLLLVSGAMQLGLHDMRPESSTYGLSRRYELRETEPLAVAIPPGVAHGFYFPAAAMHLYAVDHYWNLADELGCAWSDPDHGLAWDVDAPRLSDRDRTAGSFAEMAAAWAAARPRAP